jgi:hypothetical protein
MFRAANRAAMYYATMSNDSNSDDKMKVTYSFPNPDGNELLYHVNGTTLRAAESDTDIPACVSEISIIRPLAYARDKLKQW